MTSAVSRRAARMTGLKKPRPLKQFSVTVDTQLNSTVEPEHPEMELSDEMEKLSLIQSRAQEFVKAAQRFEDELPVHFERPSSHTTTSTPRNSSSNNNSSSSSSSRHKLGFPHSQSSRSRSHDQSTEMASSFTAVILLPGRAGTEEKLVLASTSMDHILKASSILAQHMMGELVYIDPVHRTQNSEINSLQQKRTPTCTLQADVSELPDLVKPGSKPTSKSTLNYTVKDLLMLSKQTNAKLAPRNWRLIKEAFPELISHEDHYFEPFDLKACSPEALGRPTSFVTMERVCRMDVIESRPFDGIGTYASELFF